MDIMELATKLLNERMGLNVDSATIQAALSGLLGDGQGGIDLGGLAGKMAANGNLGSLLNSWLGDGANSAISADSLMEIFGQDSIAKFASTLGTDTASATQGLADVLPQVVDQASSGGSLLDSVGGVGGLMGMAKSFFK